MPGFAGFDRAEYPGDNIMAWLKKNTNLVWCGYYLDTAASNPETSWLGTRARLISAGWGLGPLYAGQGSQSPSAQAGTTDGQAAVERMKSEGFPQGSFVYLEPGAESPWSDVRKEYVASWCDVVSAEGYGAGVHCSQLLAQEAHVVYPACRIWAVRASTNRASPFPAPFPEVNPTGSGYPKAYVWQHALKVQTYVRAGSLQILEIGLNSAASADPSAP